MEELISFNARHSDSKFFFISDHAGNLFPDHLGTLGVGKEDLGRHIVCDLGIKEVGRALAERLDATLIEQRYSRLLVDCNRRPECHDSIPVLSDGTEIPGNKNLSEAQRKWRYETIFYPYHRYISKRMKNRLAQNKPTLFVSLHSFTPRLKSFAIDRPWEIGLLFDQDRQTSASFEKILLEKAPSLCLGKNEPYFLDVEKEYSVITHAQGKCPVLEIELRQDILQTSQGQQRMAYLLEESLRTLEKEIWG